MVGEAVDPLAGDGPVRGDWTDTSGTNGQWVVASTRAGKVTAWVVGVGLLVGVCGPLVLLLHAAVAGYPAR